VRASTPGRASGQPMDGASRASPSSSMRKGSPLPAAGSTAGPTSPGVGRHDPGPRCRAGGGGCGAGVCAADGDRCGDRRPAANAGGRDHCRSVSIRNSCHSRIVSL
jgi:hypothetical protein